MFDENIRALKDINPQLADMLVSTSFDKARETVDVVKAQSDDFILLKQNVPLECKTNPVEEAFYNVQTNIKQSLDKFDFILIYGLGIGYTLDYVFEKFESRIIVVEPDIDVLRIGFEMVDYAKYLESGRVFITTDVEDVYQYILDKYIINDKVEILFLQRYMQMYDEEIRDFTARIYDTCALKSLDVNTIKNNSKLWVYSSLAYAKNSGQLYPISMLDNKFEGRTALIVGAGPGLADNVDYIKKYRDRFAIFAVNRSINFLAKNDIIPDFAVFTEHKLVSQTVNKDIPYLCDMNFITDIKVDSFVYDLPKKRCFTYYPKNYALAEEIALKNQIIKLYETAGTVTFCALNSAKNLGFKNIVLVGCDLAFKDDVPYCDKMDAIVEEGKITVDSLEKKIVQVKSVTGQMVNTREDYALFVKQFENFIQQNPQLKIYNITSFGAYIDGSHNFDFPKVMDLIQVQSDSNSVEDILSNILYNNSFNPVSLKHSVRNIVKNDEKYNFEIRVDIKSVLEHHLNDEFFYVKAIQILEKISKTLFLSQLIQFEVLNCTKLLIQTNSVKKRAQLELFLENTLKELDELNNALSKI